MSLTAMIRRGAAFALVVGLCAGTAFAQDQEKKGRGGRGQGGGRGGTMDLASYAVIPEVSKYLKLTEDEVAFVKLLSEENREQSTKFFETLGDLSREERGPKIAEWAAKRAPETEKKLTEILKADRVARLKQVQLQTTGIMGAMMNPVIAKQLEVTDSQKTELTELQRASGEKMRELFQSGDREAMAKAMEEARKENETKVMALLSDAQKTKWKELTGEPIDFKLDMRSMFGGGGRGPGGGDGKGGEGKGGGRRKKKDPS